MTLAEMTDVAAIHAAMDEFDRIGRDAFLTKYRFGQAKRYFAVRAEKLYDSKAILGAAHAYQHGVPLHSTEFSGGDATVVPVLARLGFRVTVTGGELTRLSDLIEEGLLLQTEWNHRKTEAMDRRGQIVRSAIPAWLRGHFDVFMPAVSWPGQDLDVEGRDGTGPKTEIPWTRLHSQSRSPSATNGWYVVFLFSALGDRCYLSLCHGATRWDGVEFKPRPLEEMKASVAWARDVLTDLPVTPGLQYTIALDARRSPLGPSYEAGTIAAFEYELDTVPSDEALLEDIGIMLTLLSHLYAAEDADPRAPGVPAPEIEMVADTVADAAGRKGRRGRQGFRLTKAEQRAVERRAVQRAMEHFREEEWDVAEVGDHQSYDLKCSRQEERLFVEVKGTTSTGDSVLLTKNEVALHREHFPNNALAVVHSIILNPRGEQAVAQGGVLEVTSPWEIAEEDLTAIAYIYRRAGSTKHGNGEVLRLSQGISSDGPVLLAGEE